MSDVNVKRLADIATYGFGRPVLIAGGSHPTKVSEDLEYVAERLVHFYDLDLPEIEERVVELARHMATKRPEVTFSALRLLGEDRLTDTEYEHGIEILVHAEEFAPTKGDIAKMWLDTLNTALGDIESPNRPGRLCGVVTIANLMEQRNLTHLALGAFGEWADSELFETDAPFDDLLAPIRHELESWISAAMGFRHDFFPIGSAPNTRVPDQTLQGLNRAHRIIGPITLN